MTSQIFRDDLFENRVAIVTGGGSGIGAAVTRELASLGATVVIASRKEERIQAAAKGLSEELGRPVHGMTVNIRERESVDELIRSTIDRFGALDILVNNGGGQFFMPAQSITERGWNAVVETNLTGTWHCTQAAANAWMLKNGGRIVNITMNTVRGFPGMAHSVAARSGVEGLTKTLAVEWAAHNIQINCVAPGVIASSGLKNYPDAESMVTQAMREIPAKRLGKVGEIAWAVAWLASPAGAYVTGQTIVVDGGRTLWGKTWPIPDPEPMPAIEIPVEPWDSDS